MIVEGCPSQDTGHAPTVAFGPFFLFVYLRRLPFHLAFQSHSQGWGPKKKGRIRERSPQDSIQPINHGIYRGGNGTV